MTRRSSRREVRVTVRGPVRKPEKDGMPRRGWGASYSRGMHVCAKEGGGGEAGSTILFGGTIAGPDLPGHTVVMPRMKEVLILRARAACVFPAGRRRPGIDDDTVL